MNVMGSILIALLAMVKIISPSKDVCLGGVVNQRLCQKFCYGDNCQCSMSGQSEITSCTQTCHWLHSKSCPRMSCDGPDSCNQHCFLGECSMYCLDTNMCSQSCTWKAKCKRLVCSAKVCHQICSNCSMECSSHVDTCEQMCTSGVCDMVCHAKKCRRMCNGECNVIGVSSTGTPSRGLLRVDVVTIIMFSFLVRFLVRD